MELKVVKTTGSSITLKRTEYHLTVAPFDTGIRGTQTSLFTAKGQILVAAGAGSPAVLNPGTAGQSLSPNPAAPLGLEWIAGSGSSVSTLTNLSGVQLNPGDVVVLHPTEDRAVTTSTLVGNMAVVGVVQEDIANAGSGAVATFAGHIVVVNCDSAVVTKGMYLVTSSSAKLATGSLFFTPAVFARALTAKAVGVGTVYAMLLPINPQVLHPGAFDSLHTWLKAESLSGYANNAPITSWADSSPRNDAFGAGVAPLAVLNALNGYPGARFNGSRLNQGSATPPATGSGPSSIFAVASKAAAGLGGVYGWGTTTTANTRLFLDIGTGTGEDPTGQYYSSSLAGATSSTLNVPKVYGHTYNGTTVKLYVNNAEVGSGAKSLNVSAAAPMLGLHGGDYLNGYIFEVLVYSRLVSDLERAAIFQYLGNKFGIPQS